jgi:hypothetical protein
MRLHRHILALPGALVIGAPAGAQDFGGVQPIAIDWRAVDWHEFVGMIEGIDTVPFAEQFPIDGWTVVTGAAVAEAYDAKRFVDEVEAGIARVSARPYQLLRGTETNVTGLNPAVASVTCAASSPRKAAAPRSCSWRAAGASPASRSTSATRRWCAMWWPS